MFDKKYKKILKLLDDKIDFEFKMHDHYLHLNDGVKLSDEEIVRDLTLRGGRWDYIDKYQDRLNALCELRRKIHNMMGQ